MQLFSAIPNLSVSAGTWRKGVDTWEAIGTLTCIRSPTNRDHAHRRPQWRKHLALAEAVLSFDPTVGFVRVDPLAGTVILAR